MGLNCSESDSQPFEFEHIAFKLAELLAVGSISYIFRVDSYSPIFEVVMVFPDSKLPENFDRLLIVYVSFLQSTTN